MKKRVLGIIILFSLLKSSGNIMKEEKKLKSEYLKMTNIYREYRQVLG